MNFSCRSITKRASLLKLLDQFGVSTFKIFIFFNKSTLISFRNHVQLIETAKLSMALFKMVLEVLAPVFKEFTLFDQVLVLSIIGRLLFPTRNIQFILSFFINSDLVIRIQTAVLAVMLAFAHLNCDC